MKKIFAVLLSILTFLAITVCAENKTAVLPTFDVEINGIKIENNNRQFPLLVYDDITYVPMTYFDCRYLGLSTDWNGETNTLTIEKSNITCAYRDYKWDWQNSINNTAAVCDFNIIVNGKKIDNSKEEYPLLTFRNVTYFPLTWHFAAEEFGWEYLFDGENGLSITSDNKHAETLHLPNIAGSVATDGKYYYYNGDDGDKHVVYRAAVTDTKNPEIIFEYPDSGMMRRVNFVESEGDIYFYYFLGSSPVMSSRHVRKIQPDGTLTEEKPAYYSYSAHGYSECYVRGNGIDLKAVNPYFDSRTEFTYTVDGITTEVEPLPGRIRLGVRRNVMTDYSSYIENYIKIHGEKIYFTATDLDTGEDSALYVIDTKTGKAEKLLDGVYGFLVYNGWVNELSKDSTMIIYDNNGTLMRYTECNGDVRQIEKESEESLALITATGGYNIAAIQRTLDGKRTVVKVFDSYASGFGSVKETVFETATGANYVKSADKICVYTIGESANDKVRIAVPGFYYSSDTAESPFIYEDTLIYKLCNEDKVVRVDLY